MKRLGERIKRKRDLLQLPLNELAKKVGISSSALSQIENAKAFPSVLTLKIIADNLYTTVGELIGENEALSNFPLVKSAKKTLVERNQAGTSLYLLSNRINNKQMDTFLFEFIDGSDSTGLIKPHAGHAFCYVLKGKLEFKLDDEKYTLEPNDSFYFNMGRAFNIKNRLKEDSSMIWVSTPPL